MNQFNTFETLELVKQTSSRIMKIRILTTRKDDNLRRVFDYTYNKKYNYGFKDISDISYSPALKIENMFLDMYTKNRAPMDHLFDTLDDLLANKYNGSNAGKSYIETAISRMNQQHYDLFVKILNRDLLIGASEKALLSVWATPSDTYKFPGVSLCNTLNEKTKKYIKFPALVQTKADGSRMVAEYSIATDKVKFISRNGKEYTISDQLENEVKLFCRLLVSSDDNLFDLENYIYLDGEIVAYKNGKVMDRKTSNGLLTKVLKNTADDQTKNMFSLNIWDVYRYIDTLKTAKNRMTYKDRLKLIEHRFIPEYEKLHFIKTDVVNNMSEVYNLYHAAIAAGEEGIIVKNYDTYWTDRRSNEALKVKLEVDSELVIVGIEEGQNSLLNKLGAFVCESSDGLIKVNVGTGFDAAERTSFYTNDMIGKIITVRHNGIIKDKNGNHSLFLPRFIELRYDKESANSFKEIQNGL